MDVKSYYLTRDKLYYANVENEEKLRGEMSLEWILVEFETPNLKGKAQNDLRDSSADLSDIADSDLIQLNIKNQTSLQTGIRKPNAVFMPENGEKEDYNFIRDMIMKRREQMSAKKLHQIEEGKSNAPSSVSKEKPFVIRLTKKDNFYELCTYQKDLFVSWQQYLQAICINTHLGAHYSKIDQLSVGKLSKLNLALRKDDKSRVVLKSYSKSSLAHTPDGIEQVRMEISVLRECNHPALVQLYEVYEDELNIHLVTSHAKGPNLGQSCRYGKFPKESDMIIFTRDCLEALAYMKTIGVIHRRISTTSIVLNEYGIPGAKNGPIITGFSDATYVKEGRLLDKRIGTVGFIAPEILNNEPISDYYKTDLFSLGVTLYYIMSGGSPFKFDTESEHYQANKIMFLANKNSRFLSYSQELRSLIMKLMDRNPNKRPLASEALMMPILRNLSREMSPNSPKSPQRDSINGGIRTREPSRVSVFKSAVTQKLRYSIKDGNVVPIPPTKTESVNLKTFFKNNNIDPEKLKEAPLVPKSSRYFDNSELPKTGTAQPQFNKSKFVQVSEPLLSNSIKATASKDKTAELEPKALTNFSEGAVPNRVLSMSLKKTNLEQLNIKKRIVFHKKDFKSFQVPDDDEDMPHIQMSELNPPKFLLSSISNVSLG